MKRIFGLSLFYISWLLWGLILLFPFVLDVGLETLAVITTSLIVATEVCFALSLLLLGKAFYRAVKTRLKSCWKYFFHARKS